MLLIIFCDIYIHSIKKQGGLMKMKKYYISYHYIDFKDGGFSDTVRKLDFNPFTEDGIKKLKESLKDVSAGKMGISIINIIINKKGEPFTFACALAYK